MPIPRLTRYLRNVHGVYLLIGGAWPLLHLRSFEAITGPKSDDFLVRSVALLLLLAGSILLAQRKAPFERSAVQMAMGTSFSLGCVAVISALGGWIWKIYLIDGAIHLLFVLAWTVLLLKHEVPFAERDAQRA